MMISVKHTQRVYYLVNSLFWLATALTLPLTVLFIQSRGMDLFQVGILMGAYSLTIVLLEIPTGGLADAVGRKRVALLAYSIILTSSIVILFAFSFGLFLLGWVLNGVGRALASGALDAWFVDALKAADPEIDIQPPLAKAGTLSLLALGIGTLVGGLIPHLFSRLPTEGAAVLTPFSMTIILAGIVNIVLIIAIALLVKEPRLNATGSWKSGFHQVPKIVRDAIDLSRANRTIILLLGVSLISGLALASIEAFWSPRFAGLLGGVEQKSYLFGSIMAISFVAGMIGNMVSIPLGRALKKRYGLLAAAFQGLQGLTLIAVALQGEVLPSIGLFWMVYLGMGVVNSPHATLVNEEIPSDRRSAMLSVQSLSGYLGGIIGSVILGYFAKNLSISVAWIVAGALLLVSLWLYVGVDLRRDREVGQHEPETALLEAH